jgi:hypothetical protein
MPVEYVPSETKITCRYANGVTLVLDFLKTPFGERPGWITRLGTCPVRFVGEEGWVETGDNGGIVAHPESLNAEVQRRAAESQDSGLDVAAHARDFFDAIRSRRPTACNPTVMRNSHTACHAAASAWVLQRPLRLDPDKVEFLEDAEANGLRSRPARDAFRV